MNLMETVHLKPMGKQKTRGNSLRIDINDGGRLTVQQGPSLDTDGAITVAPDGTVKQLLPRDMGGLGDFEPTDFMLAVGGPYTTLQRPLLPALDSTVCIIREDQTNADLPINPLATHISVLLKHNSGGEQLRGTVVFIPFNELSE